MADAHDSGSCGATRAGSSPVIRTIAYTSDVISLVIFLLNEKADLFLDMEDIKKLELHKWENYLQFIKNPDNYDGCSQTLSIGNTDGLAFTEYANLFEYLSDYSILTEKYKIPGVMNEHSVFKKALLIMNWLTQKTYYSGAQLTALPDNSLEILDFSYEKGFEYAINCRDKAIVLTDLLIAYGIMAYPILLEDENHWGCHFVVHIFCSDENKWVVLDPSFNCFLQDKTNKALNIFELRDLRIKGDDLYLNGYSFNGTNECTDIYLKYFVGVTLTHITTWNSNSNDRRNSTDIQHKKEFISKLPDLDMINEYLK